MILFDEKEMTLMTIFGFIRSSLNYHLCIFFLKELVYMFLFSILGSFLGSVFGSVLGSVLSGSVLSGSVLPGSAIMCLPT